MGGFGPLRKVSEASKSKRAIRIYGIVYFVREMVGDRFALRRISVLRSWNRACVSGEMDASLPWLPTEARMTEYTKESDDTQQQANFRLFALSGWLKNFLAEFSFPILHGILFFAPQKTCPLTGPQTSSTA